MTRSITTSRRAALLGMLVLALAALAPPAARAQQGDDSVLRALTSGVVAFEAGDADNAARAFEYATTQIGAVWGGTESARQARSLWYEERVKPFKGDPYERAMAYYYYGLVFLQQQDYGNAQAAFRNAILQDAFAEEEQHRADMMLPLFLQGWALQAQGSTGPAQAAYDQVRILRPDFAVPGEPRPNVLVVAETGTAPRKVVDGVGSYKLRFFRGKHFTEVRSDVVVDAASPVALYPMEDVFWQASSRGGRKIDVTIEGKARFAQSTSQTGTVLSDAADQFALQGLASGSRTDAALGDALGLAGIAALALSARAKPAADARCWDNLPDAVHVGWLALPPGEHQVTVRFLDAEGVHLPALDQTRTFTLAPDGGPTLLWVSSRPRASSYLQKTSPRP